jgi:hypothetical protein
MSEPIKHVEGAQTLRRCSSLLVSTFALGERLRGLPSGGKCRRCSQSANVLINLREHLHALLSAFGNSSDTVTQKMLKIVEGAHSPA